MATIPDNEPPPTILELIDEAVAAAKTAAHSCREPKARDHFEFALALLRESWIDSAAPPRPAGSLRLSVSLRSAAESGQEARSAGEVVADVREAFEMFALVFNQKQNS